MGSNFNFSLDDVKRAKARKKYVDYVEYVHQGRWKRVDYLEYVCNEVQIFLEAEDGPAILILSMPPQHGKSMCLTETLPSWYLGVNQTHRVILASYNNITAGKFGRRNRAKISQYGYDIFGIRMKRANDTEIELDNGVGGMLSAGVFGGVTSYSGELIIIDDPIRNRKQANSKVIRNSLKEEWTDTFLSRFQAGSKIILIQTRWHEDDLAGIISESVPEDVKYINLPIIAEANDPAGRKVGEALGTGIGKDLKWVKAHKNRVVKVSGELGWEALYMGHPSIKAGNIFKESMFSSEYKVLPGARFKDGKIVDETAGMVNLVLSVDATFKKTDDSDFVSMGVWGKRGVDIYMVDRLKERLSFTDTIREIRKFVKKYPYLSALYIEDKANGPAIIDMLSQELDIPIFPLNPQGGKEARAYAVTPILRNGRVWFPTRDRAEWIYDYKKEMKSFPNSDHDDDVDMTTQILYELYFNPADIPVISPRDDFAKLFEDVESDEMEPEVSDSFMDY